MRGTGRSITALAAGMAIAAGGLVGVPAAQAALAPPNPTATVQTGVPFGSPTQVSIDWTEDTADDTATVTVSPAGGTGCSGVQTTDDSCLITGLTAGTPYTFTVRVFDKQSSDDTTATVAATPFTVPDKPVIVATTPGNQQAWIDWTAPATGGSAITGYTVTTSPAGPSCTPGTNTECILSGMTNGTTYSVQVTATNAGGPSLPSTAVAVVPSATSGLPGAPTGVSAVTTSPTAAEVTFTPATAVPGFPVSTFSASCTSSTGGLTRNGTASASPVTVSSLDTDKTYTCTVTATNVNGTSAASGASNAITPNSVTVPGAPTIGATTGGAQQATVSWTAPSPAPTSAVTTYQVAFLKDGVWSSPITTGSTSTSYTVTGLEAGTYNFRVRAMNVGGAGAWSNQSSPAVTVTGGTIGLPSIPTATPGVGQVGLTWSAPSTGTLTPTSYQIRYSSNSGTTWTELAATGTTATTATVSGLTNGTAYVFAVRAISGSNVSSYSANSTAATPGTPGVPRTVAGTAGDAQVALTWTAPAAATGVPNPTGYQVQYQAKGTSAWLPTTPLAATSASATVTGLTNGTPYVFRVRSMNGPIEGDWTAASAEVTPEAVVVLSIKLTKADRDRKGLIRIAGTTTGLERGDEVNIRVRIYDRNTGGWRKARTVARVQVKADGVFRYILDDRRELRVFGKIPGELRSDSIRVPRA